MSENDESRMKPGPVANRLRIDGDWKDAMKKALDKERPPEGWPDPDDDNLKKKDNVPKL